MYVVQSPSMSTSWARWTLTQVSACVRAGSSDENWGMHMRRTFSDLCVESTWINRPVTGEEKEINCDYHDVAEVSLSVCQLFL